MMKLRIRSLETKETFKIEIPTLSSLDQLKTLIAGRISSPALRPPDALRLSLNRRDELFASSSTDQTLQSLGLASGDLVFYTLNTDAFSSPSGWRTPTAAPNPTPLSGGGDPPPSESMGETLTPATPIPRAGEESRPPPRPLGETLAFASNPEEEMAGYDLTEEDARTLPVVDMEVDIVRASHSIPGFLKRVLEAEKGNAENDLGLLVIAVHAVFLESGFVAQNCEGSCMPQGWANKATTVSIPYTIPELTNPDIHATVEMVELKFLHIGKFTDVYGSSSGRSDLHRLCLDVSKFVPSVGSSMGSMNEKDEKVVFELWKMVKDRLSLPLLIDICEKNGLPPPPCFTCLPTELKVMVLELLPGVDFARVGCVSSELRYLSSNDELWKRKIVEEYPGHELCDPRRELGMRWKDKFTTCWVEKKKNKRNRTVCQLGVPNFQRLPAPFGRGPAPFDRPMFNVIGGDFDLFPVIGGAGPSRSRRNVPPFLRNRTFLPHCNCDGFNA